MKRVASALLTLAVVLMSVPVLGQVNRGSLSGLISDPQGAAVVGASVTVKNLATGEETRTGTTSQGVFVLPSLVPGKYTALVEAAGFKRAEITEITIEVSQAAKVDVKLEVGAVSEQVTVTSEAQETIN